jgi:hypothetical protein
MPRSRRRRRTAASARPRSSRSAASASSAITRSCGPDNNRSLDWDEITLDPATMRGTFKLDQHKNVNKGIKARGPIAGELVEYLLSIRPANASGPIHANPETGRPYVDICKPWKRLLAISAEMLGDGLTGKKAKFLTSANRRLPHRAARVRCTPPARRREDDRGHQRCHRQPPLLQPRGRCDAGDHRRLGGCRCGSARGGPRSRFADPAADDDDAPSVAVQSAPHRARK